MTLAYTLSRRAFLPGVLAAMLPVAAQAAIAPSGKDQSKALQGAIAEAQDRGEPLILGPGRHVAGGLNVAGDLVVIGTPGLTSIEAPAGVGHVFSFTQARDVRMSGIILGSKSANTDLVLADTVDQIRVQDCQFIGGNSGLKLQGCGGLITGNRFSLQSIGLFAQDSTGLTISENQVEDVRNNGIQVWRSTLGEDGTLVQGNRVSRVAAADGGTGQNGNAINIFRAGNVIVSGNHTRDCAFSGIRCNSASNVQVIGNAISHCGEVGLYCEFSFEGAVIANNILEDVGFGISITNFDVGGRLASCTGNVVRRVRGVSNDGRVFGAGIGAEADTVVANNVIEDVNGTGISLGWGPQTRNLSAMGNLVRKVRNGISISVSTGAGAMLVSGNRVEDFVEHAIVGMDFLDMRTGDLLAPDAQIPSHIALFNNTSSRSG